MLLENGGVINGIVKCWKSYKMNYYCGYYDLGVYFLMLNNEIEGVEFRFLFVENWIELLNFDWKIGLKFNNLKVNINEFIL